jgi:hypothetical protein
MMAGSEGVGIDSLAKEGVVKGRRASGAEHGSAQETGEQIPATGREAVGADMSAP